MTRRAVNRVQGPPGPPGTYPVHPGEQPMYHGGQPMYPGGQPMYPGGQPMQYPQQQTGQGQGAGEFQEQITKFAESMYLLPFGRVAHCRHDADFWSFTAGKKTIGSFLTKVKTKFQEFEQGRCVVPI